ncbi:MAG: Abi family protein [Bacteroides sp.]|nr:Abi family protein [Bacillota bacterium]MCM1393554.1 Abi family protein [[Eubacterium] siraeum]MCM1455358.1 Abi family protein [Bacteroides sp.]
MTQSQKKYLNYQQQVDLLKQKGLIINDEKFAAKALQEIGYYKLINAYKSPFTFTVKNSDGSEIRKYMQDVTIEQLYFLYKFDLSLEAIVFEATTSAEITFKQFISNQISSKYGIKDRQYLKAQNFAPDNGSEYEYKFADMKRHIKSEIKKQADNNHPAISWYKTNYNYYPFWVVVNILTIGSVSRIFGKLKEEDKSDIAKEYRLPHKYLSAFIRHINLVRNICAHNNVLYHYKSINAIPQKATKAIYEKLGIKINEKTGRYEKGNNDFLATLIVLKYLIIDKTTYNNLILKTESALNKLKKKVPKVCYDSILNELGLVENWKDIAKL